MLMKRLYVKIIKCSQEVCWYFGYIGRVFEVVQAVEGAECWKASGFGSTGIDGAFLIHKKDCVICKSVRGIRCL